MDKYQINPMPQQIDPALVSRAANVETATIGHIRQLGFADPAIAPMMPAKTVIGTAVTLALPGQDSTLLHDVAGRLRLGDVLVIHRYGRLAPGEQIMMVATAAKHRKDAFEAAEYLMDYLKSRAPFWKKEFTSDGAEWVDAKDEDEDALRRW